MVEGSSSETEFDTELEDAGSIPGSNPTLSASQSTSMVARVCIFATTGHEPRQARKGAAVAGFKSGAEVLLARAASQKTRDAALRS